MKLHYLSDLHIEWGVPELPGGETLLLAGDLMEVSSISRGSHAKSFELFMQEQMSKYDRVYYIMGNHEHYHGLINYSKSEMQRYTMDYTNFHILDSLDIVDIAPNWKLVACTLWTDYCGGRPEAMDSARINMNDHRIIRMLDDHRRFQPEDALRLNGLDRLAILNHVDTVSLETNLIIMTHHTPSMKSGSPKWGGHTNWLNYAFHNTGLEAFINDTPQIKYWVHGHTHDSCDYILGQCRVLCNPRGYKNENVEFDPNKFFEIEISNAK
ncbi:MAG: metallophosphoesterase [Candidatus Dormibacteria bacterium]